MQLVTAVLVVAHAGVGALWLGAMAYSLVVVQPRLGRMLGDPPAAAGPAARVEDAQRELARGNRWPVLGLIAVLWLTGIGLAGVELAAAGAAGAAGAGGVGGVGGWWWAAVAGKAALLAAATGLFWWVSWRAWPRRVFALPDELPALQRRFRSVALAMLALVGAGFVLGAVTGSG